MDNVIDALRMALGMFAFVVALSASMYLFKLVSSTSQVLLYAVDETNYYDNIQIDETAGDSLTRRTVNVETIIPTSSIPLSAAS